MSKICVRVAGRGVKYFDTREEATKWALFYVLAEPGMEKLYQYIDEAVDVSDLKEAKEVIKHVMELS